MGQPHSCGSLPLRMPPVDALAASTGREQQSNKWRSSGRFLVLMNLGAACRGLNNIKEPSSIALACVPVCIYLAVFLSNCLRLHIVVCIYRAGVAGWPAVCHISCNQIQHDAKVLQGNVV